MNREFETLILVRDLARLMTNVRVSSLVPTNLDESKNSSKWHDAVREIEATAHHMLAEARERPESFPMPTNAKESIDALARAMGTAEGMFPSEFKILSDSEKDFLDSPAGPDDSTKERP